MDRPKDGHVKPGLVPYQDTDSHSDDSKVDLKHIGVYAKYMIIYIQYIYIILHIQLF